jgi:hypothetical protein
MRMDGRALLAAVRYELEKFRCSACGQIFTAPLPAGAGAEKYSARARAVLALARYYLGVPWYRLESFQALVGVPVPDATQWDQVEHVGNCAYPLFKHLERLAAQGEVIYQDDTPTRVLTLIEENRQRPSQAPAEASLRGDADDGVDRAGGGEADLSILYRAATCRRESGRALNPARAAARQAVGDVRCVEEQ